MLTAIASRAACRLTPFARAQVDLASLTPMDAQLDGALPAVLARELGVHRAQRVPAHTPTGRVETARVVVTQWPGEPTSTAAVVRTYNYMARSAIRHDSGEQFPLDLVLSGNAG